MPKKHCQTSCDSWSHVNLLGWWHKKSTITEKEKQISGYFSISKFLPSINLLPSLVTRTCLSDIYERKSFVLDRCLDRLFQVCELRIDRMRGKATSCMFRKLDRIKWESRISTRGRLRDRTYRSRRTCLSSRESIVLIIEDDIGDIEISTTWVDEVSHTDTITITVSTDSDDRERWIDHLHSCSKWECTTMKGLCSISVDILRGFSRTSHSWNDDTFMRRDTEFLEGIFDRHDDEEIPATGTPLDVCKSRTHKRKIIYQIENPYLPYRMDRVYICENS